ncbi:MAG: 50S ribosomal protein L20, partial [Propionibacteriaceae bacterium]|nr:50S ribosomal protein L20 [Propionibacteriaceae bacterium]
MARVKRGVTAHRRHKKVLAQVKGHRATNNRLYKR